MSGKYGIESLPYGEKYNSKLEHHQEITKNNNAVMRYSFDKALAASKNPKITALSQAQRDAFALALTALTMMESTHQTKVSGTHNYAGRKASKEEIKTAKKWKNVPTGSMIHSPMDMKATLIERTKETQQGKTAVISDYFKNFASLEDFVTDQVEYMARKFPKFYEAKTYPELIRSLYVAPTKEPTGSTIYSGIKYPKGHIYATDLFQRGNTNNIFDPNMHTNQYAIKLANFMGMTKVGEAEEFLMPKFRPDMEIIKEGKEETWVISDKGKAGMKVPTGSMIYGTGMIAIRGIRGDQYIDKEYYDLIKAGLVLDKDGVAIPHLDLETKVLNQIENSNEINNEKDAINADVVQYGLTREQIRNSLASNAHGSIMFQELFPDNYQVGMDFGIQNKDTRFDVSTSTRISPTGDVTGPIDYEISGGSKEFNLYAGESGEKKYFGGQFNKKIKKGVSIKGGIQKEDDVTKGQIKLEIELP